MITKSQFCHDGFVPDVGDLVEVILGFESVIIYFFFFYFTVGSHFVALIDFSLCHYSSRWTTLVIQYPLIFV